VTAFAVRGRYINRFYITLQSYLALKLALDSRVLALVLVSRVQASASASALALKGPGLGLGLGLENPGLGLVLGLWILALTTTLIRIQYFEAQDILMTSVEERFKQPSIEQLLKVEELIMLSANDNNNKTLLKTVLEIYGHIYI